MARDFEAEYFEACVEDRTAPTLRGRLAAQDKAARIYRASGYAINVCEIDERARLQLIADGRLVEGQI